MSRSPRRGRGCQCIEIEKEGEAKTKIYTNYATLHLFILTLVYTVETVCIVTFQFVLEESDFINKLTY